MSHIRRATTRSGRARVVPPRVGLTLILSLAALVLPVTVARASHAAPSNVQVHIYTASGVCKADFTWTTNGTISNDSQLIQYSTAGAGGPWSALVQGLAGNVNAYTYNGCSSGSFHWRVGGSSHGSVLYSDALGPTPLCTSGTAACDATYPTPQPPSSPSIASVTTTQTTALVAWGDVSGETSYTVQGQTATNGNWGMSADLAADNTSHSFGSLTAGTSYEFRVRACNAAGCSAWSPIATATTEAEPTPEPSPTSGWEPQDRQTLRAMRETLGHLSGVAAFSLGCVVVFLIPRVTS